MFANYNKNRSVYTLLFSLPSGPVENWDGDKPYNMDIIFIRNHNRSLVSDASFLVFFPPYVAVALSSLGNLWQNKPSNWVGLDPCGDGWVGISCTNSRVTSM